MNNQELHSKSMEVEDAILTRDEIVETFSSLPGVDRVEAQVSIVVKVKLVIKGQNNSYENLEVLRSLHRNQVDFMEKAPVRVEFTEFLAD